MEELPRRYEPPPLSQTTESLLIAALVLLLVVPCFWQPTIHFGDLASHSYNAWLAGEIRDGRVQGLTLTRPDTNFLADLLLERLIRTYGRAGAEPIVASVLVETFFWGVFLFISGIHGRKPWPIVPSLAMLTYGLVFHFGFLNFYLSSGISMWLLWLLWKPSLPRILIAFPVTALAFFAHPMPLVWALGAALYVAICRRARDEYHLFLLLGGLGVLALVQFFIANRFPNLWTLDQVFSLKGMTGLAGVEQVWLYGAKYLIVVAGLLLIWGSLLLSRLNHGKLLHDPVVHLWWLTAVAFVIMPQAIQFKADQFALLYVPQRISLFIAIMLCAVVGGAPRGRRYTRASFLLAGAFFAAVYMDQQALNNVEQRIVSLINTLPARQRVVVALKDAGSPHLNGLVHIGSGACIGRCYDYPNYEPATHQFRVRADGVNDVVAATMDDVRDLEEGLHIVTAREAPLYSLCDKGGGREPSLFFKKLVAGEKTCSLEIPATPQLSDP